MEGESPPGAGPLPAQSLIPRPQVMSTDHLHKAWSMDRPGICSEAFMTVNLVTDIILKRKPGPDSQISTFEGFLKTSKGLPSWFFGPRCKGAQVRLHNQDLALPS